MPELVVHENTRVVGSALQSVNVLVSLVSPPQYNKKRFQYCRAKVLDLPLAKSDICQLQQLFDKAERYFQYGEFGAGKFELNLLAKTLRQQLAAMSPDEVPI